MGQQQWKGLLQSPSPKQQDCFLISSTTSSALTQNRRLFTYQNNHLDANFRLLLSQLNFSKAVKNDEIIIHLGILKHDLTSFFYQRYFVLVLSSEKLSPSLYVYAIRTCGGQYISSDVHVVSLSCLLGRPTPHYVLLLGVPTLNQ